MISVRCRNSRVPFCESLVEYVADSAKDSVFFAQRNGNVRGTFNRVSDGRVI
jgi:hypothetical protein